MSSKNIDSDSPRLLTDEEIQDIVSVVPKVQAVSKSVAEYNHSKIVKTLYLQLQEIKLRPSKIEDLKARVFNRCSRAIVHPGEPVGFHAAEAISEPITQAILNSLDWEEKVLTIKEGVASVTPIGEMIDKLIDSADPSDVQLVPENRTEYLPLPPGYIMPSCDEFGNTCWERIEAVTRHLPIGDLVKVETESGREVTATQAKSFLVWNEDEKKFIDTNGSDLKVGDILPTAHTLPDIPKEHVNEALNLKTIFPPTEYIYTSDVIKAFECRKIGMQDDKHLRSQRAKVCASLRKQNKESGSSNTSSTSSKKKPVPKWWADNNGSTFTLPYNRFDSLYVKFKPDEEHTPGLIYMKDGTRNYNIKEKFPLDEEFGFFVGAYLADGWATKTFVGISKNDPVILDRIRKFCESLGVTYHTVVSEGKNVRSGTSTDLKIHSVLLAKLIVWMCNTGSSEKKVPEIAYTANKKFIRALLDGYFSGDGTVNKDSGSIDISSASQNLVIGVSFLLSYFGIVGRMSSHQVTSNNIGSKNIKKTFTLTIRNNFAKRFGLNIGFFKPDKSCKLDKLTMNKSYKYEFGKSQDGLLTDKKSVLFDRVKSITKVKPTRETVYDFTVSRTRNFCAWNCIGSRDTFHSSGSSQGGNMGVHVFQELLNVTTNRRTQLAYIHLVNQDLSFIDALMATRAFTAVSVKSLMLAETSAFITKHPDEGKDSSLPSFYFLFESFSKLANPDFKMVEGYRKSPFLRILFDPYRLFESRITTAEIASALTRSGDAVCIYSPTSLGIVDVYADREESNKKIEKTQDKIENLKDPGPNTVSNPKDLKHNKLNDKIMMRYIAHAKTLSKYNTQKEENILGKISQDKMDILFLQMIVLQRITSESLVIASETCVKAFMKTIPSDKVISPQAALLTLFRDVRVIKNKIIEIFRGETKLDESGKIRRLWFNKQVEYSAIKYVPRNKAIKLIKLIFGEDSINDVNDDYCEIIVPDQFIKCPVIVSINRESNKQLNIWEDAMKDHMEKHPTNIPPRRPEAVVLSEYIYLQGRSPITPPLKWLIVHPAINNKVTITNSPREIDEIYGIEAARGWILTELYDLVLATDFNINPRHIQIIVNLMTYGGALLQFTARGNIRQQFGAYSECSFEHALQAFKRSAFMGSQEPVYATSTSILIGKKCIFGTGSFEVIPNNPASEQTANLKKEENVGYSRTADTLPGVSIDVFSPVTRISPDEAGGPAIEGPINAGGQRITLADASTISTTAKTDTEAMMPPSTRDEALLQPPSHFGALRFPPPAEVSSMFDTIGDNFMLS